MKYVYSVIPTIRSSFDYIVRELKPSILMFAAVDGSSVRKKLYSIEAGIIANKYNYKTISRSQTLKDMGYNTDVMMGIYKNQQILDLALKEIE